MAGQHQVNDGLAVRDNSFGVGVDDHSLGYRGDAGSHQGTGLFVFYQADAAGADRGQVGIVAECRDIHPRLARQFQYGHSGMTAHLSPVKGYGNRFQHYPPLRDQVSFDFLGTALR
jgi:hypothetical protein